MITPASYYFKTLASESDRLESSIERTSVKKAKLRGWASKKNTGRFNKGDPDRLFWKEGRYVWIEFKRAKGKPTALQTIKLRRLEKEGCYVAVCDSVRSAMDVLDTVEIMQLPSRGMNLTP